MIQLTLFPRRGFALLCLDELLVGPDGLPTVKRTHRAIRSCLKRSAVGESAWIVDYTRICSVEVHDGETPTYVVLR